MVFLPSLRKLQIDRSDDYDQHRYQCLSSKPGIVRDTSNVEHLVIGKYGQHLDNLANLTRPMHKLKRLDFESELGSYGNDRYRRMDEVESRAQFELDARSLIAERGFEWKMDIVPKDRLGYVECTARIRAAELAHELEETRGRERDQPPADELVDRQRQLMALHESQTMVSRTVQPPSDGMKRTKLNSD